jgi:hypothetical protein
VGWAEKPLDSLLMVDAEIHEDHASCRRSCGRAIEATEAVIWQARMSEDRDPVFAPGF